MPLIDRWKQLFSAEVRRRGSEYHREGAVELLEPEAGQTIRAHVEGSDTYTVVIGDSGAATSASCTCPHFKQGSYCKHLWAVLLEAQHRSRTNGNTITALTHDEAPPPAPKARKREGRRTPSRPTTPEWMDRLTLLRRAMGGREEQPAAPTPASVYYILNAPLTSRCNALTVELRYRQPTRSGWGALKTLRFDRDSLAQVDNPVDRRIIALLSGASRIDEMGYTEHPDEPMRSNIVCVHPATQRDMLGRMIETGRCLLNRESPDRRDRRDDDLGEPLVWGGEQPWDLWMVAQSDEEGGLEVITELRRDDRQLDVTEPDILLGGDEGILVHEGVAYPMNDHEARAWAEHYRLETWAGGDGAPIHVPAEGMDTFLDQLYTLPQLPPMDLPPGVGRPQKNVHPTPHLDIGSPGKSAAPAELWFDYDGRRVEPASVGRFVDASESDDEQASSVLIPRDRGRERAAEKQLFELGLRPEPSQGPAMWSISARQLPGIVSHLLAENWQVRADQKTLRAAAAPRLSITSGIDWFELRGDVAFETETGTQTVALPDILKAARAGRSMITLDDGSTGLLPEQWLNEHGLLTALGQTEGDHLRYGAAQAALLDVLLEPDQLAAADEKFQQLRQRLSAFKGVEPIDPSQRFVGKLRTYQREGLGWLSFLAEFSFGGILADDMGLGKTIQVLALLDLRREQAHTNDKGKRRPCLVVAPKSVLYNWADEAGRFTPHLRIATYSGPDRAALREHFADYDLIITSYGILRRDVAELKELDFDYIVLDEAQAIKNPRSKSARACRMMKADHRLALTGTPVENHLGDLWSIFEFLNPGMLGSGTRFAEAVKGGASDPARLESAQQAAAALRPFILRRTKQEVLTELPPKTEQTIVCEMGSAQRKIYEQLRQYYRGTVLGKSGDAAPTSNGGSTGSPQGGAMIVLEALLRLRQAACHPGLIDQAKADTVPSAKLDALLEQLEELIDEGHKALVFSQFTSMLSLVRKDLDKRNIRYEYLDGQTRDRRTPIDRFQHDDDCPLFLISLKAGGLGLNLTAAQYVFILDPWWNPAVEAQAIDRAHRIGQTQHVTAYRLICADTVEQRIIELQEKKRQLADAIVTGQQNLLSQLTREDLERLLS